MLTLLLFLLSQPAHADAMDIYCSTATTVSDLSFCTKNLLQSHKRLESKVDDLAKEVKELRAFAYKTEDEVGGLSDIILAKKKK